MTDLAGTVSMLYGMLLHQDAPMRDEKAVPPKLPPHTTAVAQITSQLLYRVVSCQCGNREGSVAASADFFYIFRASADGNPISRCYSREMGLPSAATLEM